MAQLKSRLHPDHDTLRIVVESPRDGDRLTGALHGAFGRERALPGDMIALLDALDRKTAHR